MIDYQVPDRWLVGGCSFTAGTSDVDYAMIDPVVWPSWLCHLHRPANLTNLAISGGGNTATIGGLRYAMQTQQTWSPENTLIIFNITGLERIDLICPTDHPAGDNGTPWYELGLIPFKWLISGGWNRNQGNEQDRLFRSLEKNQQYDPLCVQHSLDLINFMLSLDAEGYRWYFMIMDDALVWDPAPDFLRSFLKARSNWITFGEHLSMHSFCRSIGELNRDKFHPSPLGHKHIADRIWSTVSQHY